MLNVLNRVLKNRNSVLNRVGKSAIFVLNRDISSTPQDFRMPWNSRNTHKIKEEVRDFGSEVKVFTISATMVNATAIFKTDGSKNVINIDRWILNFRGLVFLYNAIKVVK